MIRINLLPPEYRVVEKTPIGLFAAFLVLVTIACLAGVMYAYLFIELKAQEGRLEKVKGERERLRNEVAQIEELRQKLTEYSRRQHVIMDIRSGRIYWSRKLDLLAQMTPKNIWFSSLKMEQKPPVASSGGRKDGGFLSISCNQKGRSWEEYTNYRVTIQRNRIFYSDFAYTEPPNLQRAEWNKNVVPEDSYGFKFDLTLRLRPYIRIELRTPK